MVAVALALTASAAWGAADFLGGIAGRRGGPSASIGVTVWTQALGFVLLAGLVLAGVGGGAPGGRDLLLGATAGAGGGIGVMLLYRGLTIGRMAVVAPITAAGAAALPVLFGLAAGEIPSVVTSVGVVAALLAIVLVSWSPSAPAAAREGGATRAGMLPAGVIDAIGSGIGFAIVFIALDATGDGSGLVPLVPMKVAAVAVVGGMGLLAGRSVRPPPGTGRHLVAVGALDVLAIVTFLLATRRGLLPVVAVLGSLYPAGTVLLARLVLDERMNRVQVGGIALVLAGVGLIAAG